MAKWNALDPNATHKTCTKCKELKSIDEYHRSKTSGDGHQSRCKVCSSPSPTYTPEEQVAYRAKKYPEGEKRCSNEGVIYPLSEFYNNRCSKDGLQSHCKECAKRSTREYDQANPEKVKERAHKWYEENREYHYSKTLQWKRDHPEEHAMHVRRSLEKKKNGV